MAIEVKQALQVHIDVGDQAVQKVASQIGAKMQAFKEQIAAQLDERLNRMQHEQMTQRRGQFGGIQ